jgi:hypothetical protein
MKPTTESGLADIRLIRHFIYQQLMHTICKLITYLITTPTCVISSFRREGAENCALQVCYAANSGDFLSEQPICSILRVKEYKMKPAVPNGVYIENSVKIKL